MCLHGSPDPLTAALHILLGDHMQVRHLILVMVKVMVMVMVKISTFSMVRSDII